MKGICVFVSAPGLMSGWALTTGQELLEHVRMDFEYDYQILLVVYFCFGKFRFVRGEAVNLLSLFYFSVIYSGNVHRAEQIFP